MSDDNEFNVSISHLAAGAFCCFLGMVVGFDPNAMLSHFGDVEIDMAFVRIPFGIVANVLGVYFLWSAFIVEKGKPVGVHMCVKCETPANPADFEDLRCPQCGGHMEPIKGFYDRHPELDK